MIGRAASVAVLAVTPLIWPLEPLSAQSDPQAEPNDGRLVIDILTPTEDEADPISVEQCEDEADAARIAGEIVVCRAIGEVSDGAYDHDDFIRRYGAATQGAKTPNVDGSGIRLPSEGSVIAITVTVPFGSPGEAPLMIDVEALPEAPPGSDADRIARGLPPLEGDAGGDEFTEAELGLPAAPAR